MNDNGITDALVLLIEATKGYLETGDHDKRERLRRILKFAESHVPDGVPPLMAMSKGQYVQLMCATDGMKQDASGNLYQRD